MHLAASFGVDSSLLVSYINTDKSAQTWTENISSDKNVPKLAAYIGQARGLQHTSLALDGCPCKSHALMHRKYVVVGPKKQIYKESYVESMLAKFWFAFSSIVLY